MQRFMVLTLALCVTLGACRRSSTDKDLQAKPDSREQPGAASAEGADLGDLVIAAPVRYQNLAIFPVISKVPKDEDRYITLEEGLKAGTVEIYEVGADGARIDAANESPRPGAEESPTQQEAQEPADQEPPEDPFADAADVAGDVNRLMVLNTSGRPLYLMPGEVIYGGKQDRTIGEETIILASNKPQPIDVYCVEQGRWSGRTRAETVQALSVFSADLDIPFRQETAKKLAAEAQRGKFVASAGNLSKDARLMVQANKTQVELWNGVAEANAAADLDVQSGAFTANYATPEAADQLKPYIEKLREPVAGQKQVVGAIVAINGKVEVVDVFGSTPLFKKLWPKLLKSHALDAANAADLPEANKVCKLEDAKQFLAGAMQADVAEKEVEGGLVVAKRESQGVVSFSASVVPAEADAAEAAGMGGMGFGGSVHSSAYAK